LTDNMLVRDNGAGYNDNNILKLSFYISDIEGTNPKAVTINADTGKIQYTGAQGDVTSFKVNVVAPSGVISTFDVNVK
ncbi:hypothetical protein, partial [Paenibacillus thalictri]